ncbi:MAG: HAD family hydrolase [Hyphomicrobium sp.]|uniref:HAD family hydrolase n=1 Tax=Hyphomicrobium sp. TaxID=82 RepID=UPI003D1495E9
MQKLLPSAVLVDLDNTLHDYRAAARSVRVAIARLVEETFGIPHEAVRERYELLIAGEGDTNFASGQALRMARMRSVLDSWPESRGTDPAPFAQFIDIALLEAVRPFDGAIEAYHALDRAGSTLVLTEGYADTQAAIARRLGLSVAPEKFLATKDHAVYKRDGSAFHLACKRLGVSADDAVMVGDNWTWDILGAAKAGLWTAWVAADAQDSRRSEAPERHLGEVGTFRDVPDFLETTWERRAVVTLSGSRRPSSRPSPFDVSYTAELRRQTVAESDRALITALQTQIESITCKVIEKTGFDAKYSVLHVMNVGSTSRGTYPAFPADFDIVVETACEQTRIAHEDALLLCDTIIESVVRTEAFHRFVNAIGRSIGCDDFRPQVQLASFGVRGPQSLVARYDLVAPGSATPVIGFLDVSFGLLPQIIGYEVATRRQLDTLGPLAAEQLRSEIRLAKALLKRMGALYGSRERGLRAHAVEQWVIQSLNYRASGSAFGTLDNALGHIVEESCAGHEADRATFQSYKTRFPLRHPGWWEIADPHSDRRAVNLWDLLGDGDTVMAEQKWQRLVALAMVFDDVRTRGRSWDLETLIRSANASDEDQS